MSNMIPPIKSVKRTIILEEGMTPQLIGEWTVGEVIQTAEMLSRWVQSFQVSNNNPFPMNEQNQEEENTATDQDETAPK